MQILDDCAGLLLALGIAGRGVNVVCEEGKNAVTILVIVGIIIGSKIRISFRAA